MNRRILSLFLAFLFFALPLAASADIRYNTPIGYNDHDYRKLVAFMELTDADGVRNGEKVVVPFDGYYLPAFPTTWSYYYYDHENGILYMWGVFFSDDEEDSRAVGLELYDMDLIGPLDISDCTEISEVYCDRNHFKYINASGCTDLRALTCSRCEMESISIKGCTGLDVLDCSRNSLTELDASDCALIYDIECNDNRLVRLDTEGCIKLGWLDCFNNDLTELDLSDCAELYCLDCTGNPLKFVDVPANAPLMLEHIEAEGAGTVGFRGSDYSNEIAFASPEDGAEFLGWYTEGGELITTGTQLDMKTQNCRRAVARFTLSVIMGDADGNGTVNANDALLVLRFSLGIVSEIDETAADVDGNGLVNANDALLILRASLGIITL